MKLSSTRATSKYVLAGILLISLSAVCFCQTTGATCTSKFPNCVICTSGSLACSTCDSGYYLEVDGRCMKCATFCRQCTGVACTDCTFGFFPAGKICVSCEPDCSVCSSSTLCTQCKTTFYLSDGKCQSCSSGCEECKDSKSCTRCKSDYELGNGACKAKASLQGGAIAGISVGSIVGFVIIVVIIVCICRKQQLQKQALANALASEQAKNNPSGESIHLKSHGAGNSTMMGSSALPMGGQAYGVPQAGMGFGVQQQPTYTPSPMMMPSGQYGGMPGQPAFNTVSAQPYLQHPPLMGNPGQPLPYSAPYSAPVQQGVLPPGFDTK